MDKLLKKISRCSVCELDLQKGVRPIMTAHPESKIVIVGQAPGLAVHKSGIPWDDKSGDTLRNWMQIDKKTFYDPKKVAIIPMGFCYPGKGKSGDLPPRKECAPLWHQQLWNDMANVKLTILVGRYAQYWYLGERNKSTLTETVRNYAEYLPKYFVLPHSSPRNNIWQARNEWFTEEIIPNLQKMVKEAVR